MIENKLEISFSYDSRPSKLLAICYSGILTDERLIEFWENFLNAGYWKPGYNVLSDMSDADLSQLTTEGIQILVDKIELFIDENGQAIKAPKVAFYAPNHLQFGLAMVYAGMGLDTAKSINVFRSIEKAQLWLWKV